MILRVLIGILLAGWLGLGDARSQVLLPNGQQQFVDANGSPLAAGKVFFYIPNTSTPKTTWQDNGLTSANTNPVVLDSAGRATIWGSGLYRQVLQDSSGNTIWDQSTGLLVNSLTTVNTTAALRVLVGGSSNSVLRLGYFTVGDGGQATYNWNASSTCTDDGGSCIAPNLGTGRWILSASAAVDAAAFGVLPGRDVSSSLQIAMTWACTNNKRLNLQGSSNSYQIATTLTIGNGTNSTLSTTNGCELHGVMSGTAENEISPSGAPVTIKWTGGASTMMQVSGPIYGVRVFGVSLDCNNTCVNPLILHHPIASAFEQILIENWKGIGLTLDSYTQFGGLAIGASRNTFNSVRATNPTVGSCGSGMKVGNDSAPGVLDVAQNEWSNSQFNWDGSGGCAASYGILFRFADNLTFTQLAVGPLFGLNGTGILVDAPTLQLGFPGEITFYNSSIGNGTGNLNAGWTSTRGLGFFPYPTGDGQALPVGAVTFGQFYGFTTSGRPFGITTPGILNGTGGPTKVSLIGTKYTGLGCITGASSDCGIPNGKFAGQVTNLRVSLSDAVGGGESVVATLVANGVDTVLTCTIVGTTLCNANNSGITVPSGSSFALKTVGSAAAPTSLVTWGIVEEIQQDGSIF